MSVVPLLYRAAQRLEAQAIGDVPLHEGEIRWMHTGAVVEGDDLVVRIEPGVDLPLVGDADLGEGGATRGGAEADEQQRVAGAAAVAVEIVEDVAVGLGGVEDKHVVAGKTEQRVSAAAAVDSVVAGIALDEVGHRVAEAVDVAGTLQVEKLEVVAELVGDAG